MPRFAANLSWMFQEVPMMERFRAASSLGFKGVECQLPYDYSAEDMAEACQKEGLEFIMFNAPPGDMERGEYGISGLPGRQAEFQDSIGLALDYARVLKNRYIHVLAGIVPDGETRDHCYEVYIENLIWAVRACADFGIGILIEPINTFERPGYITTLTSQAVDALTRVDQPNAGIQFDFHNAQLMEGYISKTLQENIRLIHHMQIAGIPGRTPPDDGELNYPYFFSLIDKLDYQGWVGCEYRPVGTHATATRDSLGWGKAFGLACGCKH